MKRFFYNGILIENEIIELDKELYHHIIRVLKMKKNDNLYLFDIKENEYFCNIQKIYKENAEIKVMYKNKKKSDLKIKINVYQCLPKGNQIDDIIEKNVELNVVTFTPVISERTIKKSINIKSRWLEIIKNSSEQCGRNDLMQIREPIYFKDIFNENLIGKNIIFYENSKDLLTLNEIKSNNIFNLIIGPEGGFSENEIKIAEKNHFESFSLGNNILRCHTANILAVGIISLFSSQ
mgnify:FL=1